MNDELIKIEDLRFGWPGAPALLSCDRFLLRTGEHLFIRGPSGIGKSTLLNLLAGVLTPDAGRLSLMRQDTGSLLEAARDRLRADHIGFIFQQFNAVSPVNTCYAEPRLFVDEAGGGMRVRSPTRTGLSARPSSQAGPARTARCQCKDALEAF